MALFEQIARTATVRALGRARVMTIDKATLLRRVQEDPALALRMLEHLCQRLRTERAKAPEEVPAPPHSNLAGVAGRSESVMDIGADSDPTHE
jgi:CRP-like cAMP-binding protein